MTDLAIIGAGAAGLMAGIWAGRTQPEQEIVMLDGAAKLGAKILISGGGRCNVTHAQVETQDFCGSTPPAIAKVLRRFEVAQTVAFFRELGVELKQEESGKLFPVTDSARTVLQALLQAAQRSKVKLLHPRRVDSVQRLAVGFLLRGSWGETAARRLVLATGGKSLPKTGSDGHGYAIAQALGHTLTPIQPALVPLLLPRAHFLCSLSGLTLPATLELRSATGKRLKTITGSTLCTHFGLSGPAVLDMSRHYLAAQRAASGVTLQINWWPERSFEQLEQELQQPGRATVLAHLRRGLPERLARGLCDEAGLAAETTGSELTRGQRFTLARLVTQMPLPITGDRGFNFAEVTAGGVPLRELHLQRMESRVCPGLFLCGEICDVDGRIGGFNFQWAWASGHVAGVSAAN
ncbi:MAG: hypothetical protein DKINENOH_03870 [bacterium]|nr:hypothetical protein [bacterium]